VGCFAVCEQTVEFGQVENEFELFEIAAKLRGWRLRDLILLILVVGQKVVIICSKNQGMEFQWDETKRLTNLRKHGIDFIDVPIIFDGDIVTVEDDRFNYGEQRFVTLGFLQGRVVAVVYTEREECIRIISARKATKYEQQIYFEQLSN
jgi:uncharacterized protein